MIAVADALARAVTLLTAAGIAPARREARLLLVHALGLPDRTMLDPAARIDAADFDAMVARRAAREPLAFITGRQGFWTLDLAVAPTTLIPRADTETLISAALAARPDRAAVRTILDLGTGTGALLLAALMEYPHAWGVGTDRSAAAGLAARNARDTGLAARAMFVCGSWDAPLAGRFDLLLSNPPYIPAADIAGLMPEVARHEPATALDGGADGLDAYRAIVPRLPHLLAAGGVAILELGHGQSAAVIALARTAGLRPLALRADFGGIARALVLAADDAKKSFGSPGAGG